MQFYSRSNLTPSAPAPSRPLHAVAHFPRASTCRRVVSTSAQLSSAHPGCHASSSICYLQLFTTNPTPTFVIVVHNSQCGKLYNQSCCRFAIKPARECIAWTGWSSAVGRQTAGQQCCNNCTNQEERNARIVWSRRRRPARRCTPVRSSGSQSA